jgi:hypothetical protein
MKKKKKKKRKKNPQKEEEGRKPCNPRLLRSSARQADCGCMERTNKKLAI